MEYGIDNSIVIDFSVPPYLSKTIRKLEECYAKEKDSFNFLALLEELDQDVKEANLDGKLSYSQAKRIFARYGIS